MIIFGVQILENVLLDGVLIELLGVDHRLEELVPKAFIDIGYGVVFGDLFIK